MQRSKLKNYLFLLIIFLSIILRFYKIEDNPPGLYWDEVSNGYNAYSVLKTGKDEYGVFMPTIFRSYDDYKPPIYIYSLVPSIAVFDLTELAVRFPSALAGVLTVLLTYVLTKKVTASKKIALFAAFFLAVSPWHLQFSRGGFEANLMQFLIVLGIVFFLSGLNNYRWFVLSAICLGLALNTYQGGKVWVPLIIFVLITCFLRKFTKETARKLVILLSILLIFSLPIALEFQDSITRGKSVSIFSQKDKNNYELFIKGYLSHYSPAFLFIKGDTIGRHAVPGMGQLYVFEIPLVLIGIFNVLKRNKYRVFIISWFLIAPIPAALSSPVPHALRSITFLPLFSIFAAIGLLKLYKSTIFKKTPLLALLFLLIGFYNILTYLHLYYIHYPKQNGPDWQEGYRELMIYVRSVKEDYETIAISELLGKSYIYTLFYLKFDPESYQHNGNSQRFDNFEFFKYSWQKTKPGKALIVNASFEGTGPHLLKEIRNSNNDTVFKISEPE